MIARTKRKTSLLNWRLRLQTSGIYRVSAIPGSRNTGAGRASPGPGLVWPRKSALRLHPCRALPSAPVSISLAEGQAFVKLVVVVDREE
jgi:hypothetical protein